MKNLQLIVGIILLGLVVLLLTRSAFLVIYWFESELPGRWVLRELVFYIFPAAIILRYALILIKKHRKHSKKGENPLDEDQIN